MSQSESVVRVSPANHDNHHNHCQDVQEEMEEVEEVGEEAEEEEEADFLPRLDQAYSRNMDGPWTLTNS
jgi:hypothetical protein